MDKINRTRTHISSILHKSVNVIWSTISIIFVFFLSVISELDEPLDLSGMQTSVFFTIIFIALVIVAVLLVIFIAFLQWRNTYFSAGENDLTLEKGIMFKRTLVMPFAKINTVDIGANIFQRMIGTCTLKINSGALGKTDEVDSADLKLQFKLADGNKIRDFIVAHSAENNVAETSDKAEKEQDNVFHAGFWDFFLYGLTKSKSLHIFVVLLTVLSFSGAFIDYIISIADRLNILGYIKYLTIFEIINTILIIWVSAYIVSTLFSIAFSFIRYYGFTVRRVSDSVEIKYGLINLKSYSLPVRNIHAIITKQSFWQNIAGLCSVEAVSVGYGNEQRETAMLFPIVKMKKLNEVLRQYLPEYIIEDNYVPRCKKALPWKIISSLLRWLIFGLIITIPFMMLLNMKLATCITINVILASVGVVRGILRYKNSRIGYSESTVNVMSGCFSRSITHIKMKSIQAVSSFGSIIYRKYGLVGYTVSYFSSKTIVNGMSEEHLEEISKIVENSGV